MGVQTIQQAVKQASSEMAIQTISSVKKTCDSAAQTTFTDKLQCCKSSADHAVKLNKNYNNNHLANLNKK